MVVRKRMLLWDWTNSGKNGVPQQMDKIPFDPSHPFCSVANWSGWSPAELKGRAPFRPMISNRGKLSGDEWTAIQNTKEEIILYYNEPDLNGISPQQAADDWHSHVVPLRRSKGKKLCSPSCVGDDAGLKWLSDWMDRVKDSPPDFIGIHYYGTDGNACKKFLEEVHNKFPQHPVMITEIASISRNYEDVLGFTTQLSKFTAMTLESTR